jgi:CheY-like chemotaxis protein
MEMEAHWQQLRAQQQQLVELNEELQRAMVLAQSASQAKSAFLANMSHELRTPLTAVLGYAEVLQSDGSVQVTRPDIGQAMEAILRNGEHLLNIINDILDLSRIEAGKLEVERLRCSPQDVVQGVQALMQMRAERKGLRFTVRYATAIPASIETDPTRLRQILINLVGNAIKFTERGAVQLAVRLIDDANTPQLEFEVSDSGLGMEPAQLDRLFRPFTQADVSTTRQFGGTGLGLAISRHLARLLGGDIAVQSTPDVGSTFWARVATGPLDGVPRYERIEPTSVADTQTRAGAARAEMRCDGCRVLLAEDGVDNQRLITIFLERAGVHVTAASNGRDACELALAAARENQPFDVILMDMQMPIMDGYTATRALRVHGYDRAIIALTAHAMSGDRDTCLAAGCDDYVTKPINRRALLEVVNRYTTQCAHHPPAVS